MSKDNTKKPETTFPKRKLSIIRLFLGLIILSLVIYGIYLGGFRVKENIVTIESTPYFAPYVDITSTPRYAFEQPGENHNQKNVVLAFIVSSSKDACTPAWGSLYTLDEANQKLDLDRRIARFNQLGGRIAVSFGGLLNEELAINCSDINELVLAYKKVIDRYDLDTIDLDIEGDALRDIESIQRRANAIAKLQNIQKENDKNLAVWLTLPVAPQGLTEEGANAVSQLLNAGVDLAGVNIMTMDYNDSKDKTMSMRQASEEALIQTHRQLKIIYSQAGVYLNEASIWRKLGATPMIGQNDVVDEIFSLEGAVGFNQFILSKGITRLSIWSANRDVECGENYVNVPIVSDSCSGVKQEKFEFSDKLGQGFNGDITSNSKQITVADVQTVQLEDNPETSPYQIWTDTATYLEGTKVVWHQNVYQAKWWTQGDLPDNPVLQIYETPWQLIGPVLPGETPVPQPTLPPGTYPVWSGTEIYDSGDRVLFQGVPYQAKWWTQGDSPAASTSNPDSSPWKILNWDQIQQIKK